MRYAVPQDEDPWDPFIGAETTLPTPIAAALCVLALLITVLLTLLPYV